MDLLPVLATMILLGFVGPTACPAYFTMRMANQDEDRADEGVMRSKIDAARRRPMHGLGLAAMPRRIPDYPTA